MTNLLHTKKKIIHFFPRLINGNEFLARNSFGDYVNRILGGILIPWIQYIEMWRLWLTGLAMWCMRSRITFEAKRHPLISHRAKEREGERVRNSKTRVNSFWSIKGGCVRLCYNNKNHCQKHIRVSSTRRRVWPSFSLSIRTRISQCAMFALHRSWHFNHFICMRGLTLDTHPFSFYPNHVDKSNNRIFLYFPITSTSIVKTESLQGDRILKSPKWNGKIFELFV